MKKFGLLAVITFMALSAGVANATITLYDTTLIQPYVGSNPNGQPWTDIIGSAGFDIYKAVIDWQGANTVLSFFTNAPQSGVDGTQIGDLALDFNRDGFFGSAVKMTGSSAGSIYQYPIWQKSKDFYGDGSWIYAGKYDQAVPKDPIVFADGGNQIGTSLLTWTLINSAEGKYRVDINMLGMATQMQNFDFVWASGRCGNDVMAGTAAVPIPGAVWLLGSGLLGLVAAKKRLA